MRYDPRIDVSKVIPFIDHERLPINPAALTSWQSDLLRDMLTRQAKNHRQISYNAVFSGDGRNKISQYIEGFKKHNHEFEQLNSLGLVEVFNKTSDAQLVALTIIGMITAYILENEHVAIQNADLDTFPTKSQDIVAMLVAKPELIKDLTYEQKMQIWFKDLEGYSDELYDLFEEVRDIWSDEQDDEYSSLHPGRKY